MFRDYYDIVEPLTLPIRGKQYRIPAALAGDVARFRQIRNRIVAEEAVSDEDREFSSDENYRRVFLGTALDQMRDDGVLEPVINHAAQTAYADVLAGRAVAEQLWEQTDPKVPTPPPTKPQPRKASTRSRSTAAAATTSSRARTSGTKRHQK